MSTEIQHQEIMTKLGVLDTKMAVVETKVDDLRAKVAIQNGRVATTEGKVGNLEVSVAAQQGESRGSTFTWDTVIKVAGFIGTALGIVYGIKHF